MRGACLDALTGWKCCAEATAGLTGVGVMGSEAVRWSSFIGVRQVGVEVFPVEVRGIFRLEVGEEPESCEVC